MRSLTLLLLALSACASTPSAAPRIETILFVTVDCPISNAFAPELNRIAADYHPKGVGFSFVYTDLTHPIDVARRHAREFGFAGSVALDEGRRLSKAHGATITPEAVVLVDGARVYRGRIDDRYLAPGQYRAKPTTRDLRDAIEAAIAGRPVARAETEAVGCPIAD